MNQEEISRLAYAGLAEEFRVKDGYIPASLMKTFEEKKDGFDYKKLVSLLNELNECFGRNQVYSCFMLMRAVLDHVPPLLGCRTFDEVVLKYQWARTNRHFMQRLRNDYRKLADNALHDPISSKEPTLTMEQLPPQTYLHKLLQECADCPDEVRESMRKELEVERVKKERLKNPIISFPDEEFVWASNYSGFGAGFRVVLNVDNYNRPLDYVSGFEMHGMVDEKPWGVDHFMIERQKLNTALQLDEGKLVERTALFIGYGEVLVGEHLPDFKEDIVTFVCKFRSGGEVTVPIPSSWLRKS